MIVTTSYRVTPLLEQEAHAFARKWGWPYRKREKLTVKQLKARYETDEMIILSREDARWVGRSSGFAFHPSLAVVRIKRLNNGESDVLQEVAGIKAGDSFLDATLGFAADAITAAHIVGPNGRVTGLESDSRIAALAEYGLTHFPVDVPEVVQAMRRVAVEKADHLSYLRQCPDNAFDVVYFDPMFREEIGHSRHMEPLRHLADHRPLSAEAVAEACRVARKCVILKEKSGSAEFERLGFQLLKKKPHAVSYGIIEAGD